jgi:DNA (cytosine-5)-methyltransferase 1
VALTFGSLFAGIGGFDLGFERAGMKCKWQVEINPFAVSVLEKHWPKTKRFRDVREFDPQLKDRVDVVCGGFPCQDISLAGSGKGLDGERSGLWTEYFRIVSQIRPKYVVVENVSALLRRGIDRVLGDLAGIGYGAEWQTFFASDFALPHRRERICIVAYPDEIVRSEREGLGLISDGEAEVFGTGGKERAAIRVQTADHFIGVDDGVSRELYGPRAEAVGNAVVPAAFEWIGRLIVEHDKRFGRDYHSKLAVNKQGT